MTKTKAAGRRTATRKRTIPGHASRATPGSNASASLVAEWPVPTPAALGSSVRAKGIEREIRARLPWLLRNGLTVENGRVVLSMPEGGTAEFENASTIVAGVMDGIDTLPVLPREIEDILTITAHERQKWLKDGRLKSVGTRTVKLRGRAKAVTFHVFAPRDVEDILDRDLPALWREDDARAIAENRKRGAGKAALTRANKRSRPVVASRSANKDRQDGSPPKLADWEAFATEGFLR